MIINYNSNKFKSQICEWPFVRKNFVANRRTKGAAAIFVKKIAAARTFSNLYKSIKIIKNKYINNIKIVIVGDGSEKIYLIFLKIWE